MQDMAALKGQDVEVTVIEVDPEFKKIVLSMSRAVQFKQLRSIHLGALMWGEVRRVEEFGAFIGLEGTRISGLLHVSNISRSRVESVSVSATAVFCPDCFEAFHGCSGISFFLSCSTASSCCSHGVLLLKHADFGQNVLLVLCKPCKQDRLLNVLLPKHADFGNAVGPLQAMQAEQMLQMTLM